MKMGSSLLLQTKKSATHWVTLFFVVETTGLDG